MWRRAYMARTKKRRVKRRKRKMPMERSRLPANRVVSANQYLHLQRRMDEMQGLTLGKTRGDRRSDYARSHGVVNVINVGAGTGYQGLSVGEKEALNMLRNAPDGLTPAEQRKKHQDREWDTHNRIRQSFDVDTTTPKRGPRSQPRSPSGKPRRSASFDLSGVSSLGSLGSLSGSRDPQSVHESALSYHQQAGSLFRRMGEESTLNESSKVSTVRHQRDLLKAGEGGPPSFVTSRPRRGSYS